MPGDALAAANVQLLEQAGVDYIVSTGGAAGIFSCATDAGMETFLGRWASSNLIGVDFDIEAGQSQSQSSRTSSPASRPPTRATPRSASA